MGVIYAHSMVDFIGLLMKFWIKKYDSKTIQV